MDGDECGRVKDLYLYISIFKMINVLKGLLSYTPVVPVTFRLVEGNDN